MDKPELEAAPKILENLVAAGLVSHELIGDPARIGTETAVLAALCARVSGPVYRLGAFHYAFRPTEADLGGALAGLEPGSWAAAIEAALGAEFGEEAVWVTGTDLVTSAEGGLEVRQILFLKAAGGAVAASLAEAPELEAVVHAGILARAAETAAALAAEAIAGAAADAGGEARSLARGLEGLAARVAAFEAALESRLGPDLEARIAEAVVPAIARTIAEAVPGAVAAALADVLPSAVAGTVPDAVARVVPDAVSGAVSSAVSEAMAEAVASEVAREVGAAVEGAVGGAMREVAAVVARTAEAPDAGIERVVSALELIVGRLGEQAARASEQAARQDALASGIVALEAAMEELAAAGAAREADRDATFAAFENRLGLALAEFLAQVGIGAAGANAAGTAGEVPTPAARVVEMGSSREEAAPALGFAAAARTAQIG